jgi:hypothetical protein
MDYHQTLFGAFLGSSLSFTEKQLVLVSNSVTSWPSCLNYFLANNINDLK